MASTKNKRKPAPAPKPAKNVARERKVIDAGRATQLASVVAAFGIAVLVNVLSARHYSRADWTTGKLYTLTPPTLETLHSLNDTVQIWILLGGGDPMEQSIKHLITSYEAETTKLDVHYIDPDKDALAFDDVRKRFKLETGRTNEGRVVADAIAIVVHGDRHWFLTMSDMVEVTSAEDAKAKPREEQAFTGAIRNVLGGERTKVCFVAGHGERSLEDASDEGLGLLREILDKDNFDPVTVDTTPENAHEPYKGCAAVIVSAPSVHARSLGAMTDAEITRLRTYLLDGGNMLLVIGPEDDAASPAFKSVIEPFGIELGDRLVLDVDPKLMVPDTRANTFVATVKAHAVTQALVATDENRDVPHVVLDTSRVLNHVAPPGAAPATDLVVSSDKSFAVSVDRATAIARTSMEEVPEKEAADLAGPFVLAMASERPKPTPAAPHGPRVVVIGSSSAMGAVNWKSPTPFRGAALLVENSIAWLASKPEILDIPSRPTVSAGLRVNEEARAEVRNYVLVFMPLAGVLLGVAVGLRRRSTEGVLPMKKKPAAPSKREDEEDSEDEEDDA